jgi:uncharacterized protein (TIGR02452 family)
MDTYERNIAVFKENRKLAVSKFKNQTDSLLKNTKVYKLPLRCKVPRKKGRCKLEFNRNDTVSSIIYYTRIGYNVCALNFADALTPGGLVEMGEVTQEEDICRCSNLYESLIKEECLNDYYLYNRKLLNNVYSDRLIYSNGVSIIRESLNYSLLNNPLTCNIVTCPAPVARSCDNYYEVVKNRIRGILSVSSSNRNNAIILGAWGCGAFGGDAEVMGRAFAEAIKDYTCFDLVVFSIKSTHLDRINNYSLFQHGFYSR